MSASTPIGEFAGCLYERPTPPGSARDWRVDPATGTAYPFDLTRDEISKMRLAGVPIKIEHAGGEAFARGDEVGRVVDSTTDPATGYTACKFALHDTVAGRTIARLIRSGNLDSLSLGHTYDTETGNVEAKEVSVCFNGAREGTRLFKESSEYDRFKSIVASGRSDMSAPPTDSQIANTGAPAPPEGVDPAPVATEPSPEVARGAEEMDLPSLLDQVTANADEKLATELYRQIANLAEKMRAGEKTNADLLAEKEKLEKQVQDVSEANNKRASEVVATMNALLEEFACGQSINCGLEQKQAQEAVFAAVPVLASAIHAQKHRATESNLESIRAGLAAEIRTALQGPSPWKETLEPAPAVAVNASARAATDPETHPAQRRRFAGFTPGQQNILSSLGSFGEGGRLTPDMMPKGFKGTKA